jgi:hypothetical protein
MKARNCDSRANDISLANEPPVERREVYQLSSPSRTIRLKKANKNIAIASTHR